jgi:anti-anti-sigma factor
VGQLLHIAVGQLADIRVVSVDGEVDLSTVVQLEIAVIAAIDEAAGGVVVLDLTGVTFLSSNGISTLLQSKKHASNAEVELRIVVAAGSAVRRSLDITGLLDTLANYVTVSAAISAERPSARRPFLPAPIAAPRAGTLGRPSQPPRRAHRPMSGRGQRDQ